MQIKIKGRNDNVKILIIGMIRNDIETFEELGRKIKQSSAVIKNWTSGKTGLTSETLEFIESKLDIEFIRSEMRRDLKGKWYLQ